MKKMLYFCFIIMVFCLITSPLSAQDTGDVNNDGSIDIIDALLVVLYYVGLDISNFNPAVADVNCDDTINIVDALFIAQYFVGYISSFPECQETPSIPDVDIEWHKKIGGNCLDNPAEIQLTSDNGFIIAANSCSTNIEGCVFQGHSDYYIIKLDSEGAIEWQRMYGGSDNDDADTICETTDGGYITAGTSDSLDIDGCINHGGPDSYIVKIDSTGSVQWQTMIGGNDFDCPHSIQTTPDNGYIFAGRSRSTDIEGNANNGVWDCYVVKLDSQGVIEWQKLFGGSQSEQINSIHLTSDNGYILAGDSYSTDIDGCINIGGNDMYLVKMDANGNIEWQKMIGGTASDIAFSMQITQDNGFILVGVSYSIEIPGYSRISSPDSYIVKCDSQGEVQWQRLIGGNGVDLANSVSITPDNGFVIAGRSTSTDIEGCPYPGESDIYIVKLDANGNTEWQTMIGGSGYDDAVSILGLSVNSCIVASYTNSTNIEGTIDYGSTDIYLAKLNVIVDDE